MTEEERLARGAVLEPVVVKAATRILWRGLVERQVGANPGESYRATAVAALDRLRGYAQRWT